MAIKRIILTIGLSSGEKLQSIANEEEYENFKAEFIHGDKEFIRVVDSIVVKNKIEYISGQRFKFEDGEEF